MGHALASGESAVQDAIVAALAEYCYAERLRFRHTLPYANQQGFKPGRVCADMAAVLSDGVLLILEIKAATLDARCHKLNAFKDDQENQLKHYQHFEKKLKIPVHYAFNLVDTLAQTQPGKFSPFTCIQTLTEIGLAHPRAVNASGEVKTVAYTLFQYLRKVEPDLHGLAGTSVGSDKEVAIMGLLDLFQAPISNSVFVLAFSADAGVLALDAAQLQKLHQLMHSAPQTIDSNKFPKIAKYLADFNTAQSQQSGVKDKKAETSEMETSMDFDPAIVRKDSPAKTADASRKGNAKHEKTHATGSSAIRPKK